MVTQFRFCYSFCNREVQMGFGLTSSVALTTYFFLNYLFYLQQQLSDVIHLQDVI